MKKCKTCGFLDPARNICPIMRLQVDPTADFCSKHIELQECGTCPICGKPIYNTNLLLDLQEDGSVRSLHLTCGQSLNTCATCKHASVCEFETNPDPMPKMVNQTTRQGNMVLQTTVKNPSRIEKFCFKCQCFDKEIGCLKENNCCKGNWEEKTL